MSRKHRNKKKHRKHPKTRPVVCTTPVLPQDVSAGNILTNPVESTESDTDDATSNEQCASESIHEEPDRSERDSEVESGGQSLSMLQQIQSGAIDIKSLSKSDRLRIVRFLLADGYGTPQIALMLKVSDRTIERDRQAIRESLALVPDPKLLEKMAGELRACAEQAVQQLLRLSNDKSTPHAVRVDAVHRAYLILSDLTQRFQALRLLPTAAHRIEADLTHHTGEVPGFDDLRAEVDRIKTVAQEMSGSSSSELPQQLQQLEEEIVRAELAAKCVDLNQNGHSPSEQARGGES